MTKLSVNINKIATLRNSRGGNYPDLISMAKDIQNFGASGITIHPRPDERHIRYQDVIDLKEVVFTELNIEGNPVDKFIDLVLKVKPYQVTLVPDAEDALTSDAGWDTKKNHEYLKGISDAIELYTELYAKNFKEKKAETIKLYTECSKLANDLGLMVNAGHDLNLENIKYFYQNMPFLNEVSIGHAIISESIYLGIENVINLYIDKLS